MERLPGPPRPPRPPRPGDEDRVRAFVSVNMPAPVCQELAKLKTQLQEEDEQLRECLTWARDEGLHITLKFLGEIQPARAKAVTRILEEIAPTHDAFAMDLARLGAFPAPSRSRVLWVGLRSGAERLLRLQREVESRLIQIGFRREERSFEPHLTLARFRTPIVLSATVRRHADFAIPAVPIDSVCLMQSVLGRGGARYTPLAVVPLGGK